MLLTSVATVTKRQRLRTGLLAIAVLCVAPCVAVAAIDPDASAASWWDASRAERIDYSNTVAAACKPAACSSSDIRFCLNDTLKPPAPKSARSLTLAKATAYCLELLKVRK